VFHPVGTCVMGPDATRAVVDARLRVHGLAGLRVIDASVFPNVTSGNTSAPTIMLAEKAADIVLRDAVVGR
jgi:choline dehydrogenase